MRSFKLLLLLALVVVCLANGTTKRALSNPTAVNSWTNVLLDCIIVVRPPPPIGSRAMSMMYTAIYDAWSCYDATAIGTRFGAFLKRPAGERNDDNRQKAFSYAAYRVLSDLFPTYKNSSQALMTSLGYDFTIGSLDATTPEGLGNTVGQAVIDYRNGDGSNQKGTVKPGNYSDCTDYTYVNTFNTLNNLDFWQPLPTADGLGQKYVTPHWGNVATFARNPFALNVTAPYVQSQTTQFRQQSQDLIDISAGLTDRQKVIADFWAGNPGSVTPPGFWIQFGQLISTRNSYTMEQDVKMYFALSGALFDASIYAWIAKRKYNSLRPITGIRNLFRGQTISAWGGVGQGTKSIQGENWIPYIPTPGFPEFMSGHSTFSGAGAEVLRLMTGSTTLNFTVTINTGASTVEPGIVPASPVTLSYATFLDAANDAGISRRYGGIHYEVGDLEGRKTGLSVGAQAYNTAQYYFSGGVTPPSPTTKPSSAACLSISVVILAILALFIF